MCMTAGGASIFGELALSIRGYVRKKVYTRRLEITEKAQKRPTLTCGDSFTLSCRVEWPRARLAATPSPFPHHIMSCLSKIRV